MAESPVQLEKVDCGNGKKKVVVREREYDLRSWSGLKTIVSVVLATVALIGTVLFSYYTAEGAQNKQLATQEQRLDDNDRRLNETFQKFHETLTEQRKVLNKNSETIIRVDTRQEVLIERVEKMDEKLDRPQ